MITDTVLEQGVVRGIVTTQQINDLRMLAREISAAGTPEPQDDEKLRFITGFNDIFVTIGLAMFLGALGFLAMITVGYALMWGIIAVASWLLAEFFSRRRRMALPSIVLLVTFAASVFHAISSTYTFIDTPPYKFSLYPEKAFELPGAGPLAFAALITAVLVGVYYLRFRVPITIAVGVASLAGTVLFLLAELTRGFLEAHLAIIVLALGFSIFALAMRYDLSDPERVTRRTDIAFWLHMLAAPMIVHAVISPLIGQEGSINEATLTLGTAGAILAIFALISLAAVIIDRRAMLVSSLIYAGYASAALIKQAGLDERAILPGTLLTLGAFILLLSAGWRPVRAMLLKLMPPHLAQRLPHPILSSS